MQQASLIAHRACCQGLQAATTNRSQITSGLSNGWAPGAFRQSRPSPAGRGAGPGMAVTVVLLPRMDGRWQPSRWAWSLLTMALVAGGASSTGATVSGGRGLSPRRADGEGLGDRGGACVPGSPSQSSLSHSDQPVSRGFWPLASLTGQGPQGPWAPLLSEGPECGVWTGWVCVLQSPGQQQADRGKKGQSGLASGSHPALRTSQSSGSGRT